MTKQEPGTQGPRVTYIKPEPRVSANGASNAAKGLRAGLVSIGIVFGAGFFGLWVGLMCNNPSSSSQPPPSSNTQEASTESEPDLDALWVNSDWKGLITALESTERTTNETKILYTAYVNRAKELVAEGQPGDAMTLLNRANALGVGQGEAAALLDEVWAQTRTVTPPTPTSISSQVVIRELGAYPKFGTTWKNLLILSGLDNATLISLARELHGKEPGTAFRLFDDDSQFEQYAAWDINYPSPRYPYPEAWVDGHLLGTVQIMLGFGGRQTGWGLFGPYGEEIADLQ